MLTLLRRRPDRGRYRGLHRPGAARDGRHTATAEANPMLRRLVDTTAPIDAEALAALLARPGAQHAADLTDAGPDRPPKADVIDNPARLFGKTTAYRRHINTCPRADYYRTKAAQRGAQPSRRGRR